MSEERFSGFIEGIQLADLIQVLCLGNYSVKLAVTNGANQGVVYFKKGEIYHATLNDKEGEKALFDILNQQEGEFKIQNAEIKEKTINRSWTELMLENARLLDEAKRVENAPKKNQEIASQPTPHISETQVENIPREKLQNMEAEAMEDELKWVESLESYMNSKDLYKLGKEEHEEGSRGDALDIYELIIKEFPSSAEAEHAKKAIEEINTEIEGKTARKRKELRSPGRFAGRLLFTTSPFIEGKEIEVYLGIVSGMTIIARDVVGGAKSYEKLLYEAEDKALKELEQRALKLNAHAVIGIRLNYETMQAGGGNMLMVAAHGTAVRYREKQHEKGIKEVPGNLKGELKSLAHHLIDVIALLKENGLSFLPHRDSR